MKGRAFRLTPKEERVCQFVEDCWAENHRGPSLQRIADATGPVAVGTAQVQVQNAVRKGFLTSDRYVRGSLRTTGAWQVWKSRQLDRATNPNVTEAIEATPERFDHFDEDDLDYLYSMRSVGGALSLEEVYEAADRLDRVRGLVQEIESLMLNHDEVEPDIRVLVDQLRERYRPRNGSPSNGQEAE